MAFPPLNIRRVHQIINTECRAFGTRWYLPSSSGASQHDKNPSKIPLQKGFSQPPPHLPDKKKLVLKELKIKFPDISYEYVAESFSKLFDVSSDKISHDAQPKHIQEEKCQRVLIDIGMTEPKQQSVIEKMIQPIKDEEYSRFCYLC